MWNVPRTESSHVPHASATKADRGRQRVRGAFTHVTGPWAATWRIVAITALLMAAATLIAAAEEMQLPRLSHSNPDWNAVAADIAALSPVPPNTLSDGSASDASAAATSAPPADSRQAIAALNRATAELFPGIAASTVPVLLPFDTAAFLNDRAAGIVNKHADDYLAGFHPSPFFLPGPAGYDAATAQASEMPELHQFAGRTMFSFPALNCLRARPGG